MEYWKNPFVIKNLSFPRFAGGPLDGVFDSPFRILVRDFSKKNLLYTEMRHVGCVTHDTTGKLSLDFKQQERPLSYQIAAHDCNFIERACEKILEKGVDIIDLNVGCPARSIIKQGAGSALMGDVPKLKAIIQCLRKNVPIPLSIKIRAGFLRKNAVTVAKMAQDCGVDALAIHPRTRNQMSNGLPDYALAARVKKALSIPVLFSGNVFTFKDAQDVYAKTGVDGFLIGRGMWSKPWTLAQFQAESEGKKFHVDRKLIFSTALKHFDLMLAYYGNQGLYNFRKHLAWYIKGVPQAAQLRENVITSESEEEIKSVLRGLMDK